MTIIRKKKKRSLKWYLKSLRRKTQRLLFLARHPRRVTCLECGFLALGEAEVIDGDRYLLATKGAAGLQPPIKDLRCARFLWTSLYLGMHCDVFEELDQDRRGCAGFVKWLPGWTPNEHRDLVLKRLDIRQKTLYGSIGLLAGAILTLIFKWLASRWGIG